MTLNIEGLIQGQDFTFFDFYFSQEYLCILINQIQDIYRVLYLKGNNNAQALEYIELEMTPSKERDEIIDFIKRSTRGIMRGY